MIIELDGAAHHDSDPARFRDMQRDNHRATEGYVVLRFGWHDVVGSPCEVAAQIARVLRTHGWRGHLETCAKCESPT